MHCLLHRRGHDFACITGCSLNFGRGKSPTGFCIKQPQFESNAILAACLQSFEYSLGNTIEPINIDRSRLLLTKQQIGLNPGILTLFAQLIGGECPSEEKFRVAQGA